MGLTSHVDRVPELVAALRAFATRPRAQQRLVRFSVCCYAEHHESGDSIMKRLRSPKASIVILVGALLIALVAPAEAHATKYSTRSGATYRDRNMGTGGMLSDSGDPDPGGGGFSLQSMMRVLLRSAYLRELTNRLALL
jgi:hypothetical protein